jgi:Kef-type K+ transport system membrane component KefB
VTTLVPLEIFLTGIVVVLAILIKYGLTRLKLPSLVGFLLLGFCLRVIGEAAGFLSEPLLDLFEFLGSIGLFILLFRVGLQSNLAALLRQLREASAIWIGDILVSGTFGFAVARFWLGLELIPCLFVAAALTATSVGVSVAVWQEMQALASANGSILIDVAELDDISGIFLLSLLLTLAPTLHEGAAARSLEVLLGGAAGILIVKALAFGLLCVLFSRYAEESVTTFFRRIKPAPDPMLLVTGTGFIIAALAAWLGLSVAVGALFAGLVFSRDPRAVHEEASFGALYDLFTPFFFIDIGLKIPPESLTAAVGIGGALLLAATAGKFLGAGTPTLVLSGWDSAALIGTSMIPRAEIAMVIIQQGRELGNWAVPPPVFSGMVLVSAVTCILAPFMLRLLLAKWPQYPA